jgi:hypothetical protein
MRVSSKTLLQVPTFTVLRQTPSKAKASDVRFLISTVDEFYRGNSIETSDVVLKRAQDILNP